MQKLCISCVNFLSDDNHKTMCDYEYWEDVMFSKSALFVPEMFECDKWELSPRSNSDE